jgi:hypothetical protein
LEWADVSVVLIRAVKLTPIRLHSATSQKNSNFRNIDAMKFRLSQGLVGKHSSGVPRLVHGRPSIEPPPKRLRTIFLRAFSCHWKERKKESKTSKKMCHMLKTQEKERIYLLVH